MQFYICQTAKGKQLAPTQADAKALDKSFKPIDVPTDKAGLMAFINELYGNMASTTIDQSVTLPPMESLPPETQAAITSGRSATGRIEVVPRTELPDDYRGHKDDCPGCLRSKRAAELMGHSDQITAITDIVDCMTERFALKRIEEHINERKKDLDADERKALKVQPVARARVVSTPGVPAPAEPGPNECVAVAPRPRVRSRA